MLANYLLSIGTLRAYAPLMTRQAILVHALEALVDELAQALPAVRQHRSSYYNVCFISYSLFCIWLQARAEARQHCAAAECARNAAQRLGQARQDRCQQTTTLGTKPPTSEDLQPPTCAAAAEQSRTREWRKRRWPLLLSMHDAHMHACCSSDSWVHLHTACGMRAHCARTACTLHAP